MNLDQFLKEAPLHLAAFEAAVRAKTAEGDKDVNANLDARAAWWFKDVAAYLDYCELEEDAKQRGILP